MSDNPIPIPELLDAGLVRRHYLPIAARTFWRWISEGKFPAPDLRVTGKAIFWRRASVETWLAEQAKANQSSK